MIEFMILAVFCSFLLLCLLFNLSIIYALIAGLILFLLYGRKKGYNWNELAQMSFSGIKTVKNILITFILIGVLTALWRDSGTITVIVCYTTKLIQPPLFLVMAFLLNCLVSFLTGTAFGTAATMGVICAAMASAMEINPLFIGGAVLSGVYFGDRCSPVSTSALLVAELTKTNIFQNIKKMLRSAFLPFLLTCGIYLVIGFLSKHHGQLPNLQELFEKEFAINWIPFLPAAMILILSLLKVPVKIAMLASIFVSLPICVLVQHTPVRELPYLMLTGYRASNPEVAVMLNGGGIISMIRVGAIVCLSSSYSGISQKTGLLDGTKQAITALCEKTTPYTTILLTSIVTCMIACNQTLTIMLTHQLCSELKKKKEIALDNGILKNSLLDNSTLANNLEDSAVIVAPLIPWSIAGAVPLATIGAPTASILFACYLYLLPLYRVITSAFSKNS